MQCGIHRDVANLELVNSAAVCCYSNGDDDDDDDSVVMATQVGEGEWLLLSNDDVIKGDRETEKCDQLLLDARFEPDVGKYIRTLLSSRTAHVLLHRKTLSSCRLFGIIYDTTRCQSINASKKKTDG